MSSVELARKNRAALRAEGMTIHKGKLGQPEVDFHPVVGAAALSLATQLSRESFSLARLDAPEYSRETIPVRFVRYRRP